MAIRRDPDAIIMAHRMDPTRRELYVEGVRDRLFLSWVFRESIDSNTSIQQIAFVEIAGPLEGGERGRLIAFARCLEGKPTKAKCFADADFDRLFGRTVPATVWLTDARDLEGYVLCAECLDKVIRMGIGSETISAEEILNLVRGPARSIGILRILSEKDSLRLPFQNTQLDRHARYVEKSFVFRFDDYLRALLQNGGVSLTRLSSIRERLSRISEEFKNVPDSEVIHGKDAFCLLAAALAPFKLKPDHVESLLWTSFDRALVKEKSNLDAVSSFLRGYGPRSDEGLAVDVG